MAGTLTTVILAVSFLPLPVLTVITAVPLPLAVTTAVLPVPSGSTVTIFALPVAHVTVSLHCAGVVMTTERLRVSSISMPVLNSLETVPPETSFFHSILLALVRTVTATLFRTPPNEFA